MAAGCKGPSLPLSRTASLSPPPPAHGSFKLELQNIACTMGVLLLISLDCSVCTWTSALKRFCRLSVSSLRLSSSSLRPREARARNASNSPAPAQAGMYHMAQRGEWIVSANSAGAAGCCQQCGVWVFADV